MSDPFLSDRPLLFTVAYQILGTVSEAEDTVQDSWERWHGVDKATVDNPRAYATRIVARVALNRLRSAGRRKENYVGPWLPEPLLTAPDVAEDVVLTDSVSMAMLVVLESLSPLERAVFVLREVFDLPVAEIARAVDRSEPAVRQVAHRAREHVHARRPRYDSDPAEHRQITEAFLAACQEGDLESLMGLLDPRVQLLSDGGGVIASAGRPISGAEPVIRFLFGIARKYADNAVELVELNGEAGAVMTADGEPIATVQLGISNGHIKQIWSMRNPAKLSALTEARRLVTG